MSTSEKESPICDPAARTGTKMQLHGLRLNCFVRLANAPLGVAGTYKAGGSYACSSPLLQIAYLSACYEGYQLPGCSRFLHVHVPVPVYVSGAITKILSDFITGNYVFNREHYCLCNLLFICKNVRARSCFGANCRDLYCMLQHVLRSRGTGYSSVCIYVKNMHEVGRLIPTIIREIFKKRSLKIFCFWLNNRK